MPAPCRRTIAHATRAALLCAALAACSSKESGTARHASSDSHPFVLPKIDSSATAMGARRGIMDSVTPVSLRVCGMPSSRRRARSQSSIPRRSWRGRSVPHKRSLPARRFERS